MQREGFLSLQLAGFETGRNGIQGHGAEKPHPVRPSALGLDVADEILDYETKPDAAA